MKKVRKHLNNYFINLNIISNCYMNAKSEKHKLLNEIVDKFTFVNISPKLKKLLKGADISKFTKERKVDMYKICIPSLFEDNHVVYLNLNSDISKIEEVYNIDKKKYALYIYDENLFVCDLNYIKETKLNDNWLAGIFDFEKYTDNMFKNHTLFHIDENKVIENEEIIESDEVIENNCNLDSLCAKNNICREDVNIIINILSQISIKRNSIYDELIKFKNVLKILPRIVSEL